MTHGIEPRVDHGSSRVWRRAAQEHVCNELLLYIRGQGRETCPKKNNLTTNKEAQDVKGGMPIPWNGVTVCASRELVGWIQLEAAPL